MASSTRPPVAFGPFQLDGARHLVQRDGQLVPLPPKAVDLLAVLVESAGTVVEKNELMRRVWPDSFVEEGNLPVTIFTLRKALGDDGETYIRTIPRRGYCFIAPVCDVVAPATAVPPGTPTPASPPQPRRQRSISTRVIAMAASLAAILVGFGAAWPRSAHPQAAGPLQSVAVLPLTGVDVDARDELLGAGLAGAVVRALLNGPIAVRPLSSSLKYGGTQPDVQAAGHDLQVDAVVTGTVRNRSDSIEVSAEMIRVADGARLWSLPVETGRSPMAVAAAIAEGIASVMTRERNGGSPARVTHPTSSADAYRAYLDGLARAGQGTVRDAAAAVEHLERAVSLDPGFADAQAALATLLTLPISTAPTRDKVARARSSATQAIAIDDGLGQAHAALAAAMVLGDWNWAGAGVEFQRAITLAPTDPEIRLWHAIHLSALGRHDDALREIGLGIELDPSSPRLNLYRGTLLLMARRYDEALAQFRRTPLEIGVVNQQVYLGMAVANAKKTRYDAARSVIERLLNGRDNLQAKAHLAFVFAESGDRTQAREALQGLLELTARQRVPHTMIAAAQACVGDMPNALAGLARARAEGDPRILFANVDPALDCARTDPRFTTFVRELGLTH